VRVLGVLGYFALFGAAAARRALNFSTRPAVSITFSIPVKSGWHWEQISISIASFVEPTINCAPHAQVALAEKYFG
jgi:hypothetical protein